MLAAAVLEPHEEEQLLMAWVRYDDGFYSHPKVTAVIAEDPAALSLHVLGNTWTNAQKRPGFVPAHQPGILIADKTLGNEWAAMLTKHGLWHEVQDMCDECRAEFEDLAGGTGYVIHDAAKYRAPERDRTTPGTPAELSEKRRAAGRKGGNASAKKRASGPDPDSNSSNVLFAGVSKVSKLPLGGVSPEPVPEPVVASNEATDQPPPEAAADKPQPLSVTQRSKAITDIYAEAEPMCRWPAVNSVVIRAIKADKWADDEICDALLRLAKEGRSVTVDALRYELQGMPSSNARAAPTGTDGRFARGSGSELPPRDSYDPKKFI